MYKTFISGRGYVGEWSLDEINQYKKELRKEAKTVLKEQNADHVVYNMTTYFAEDYYDYEYVEYFFNETCGRYFKNET